MDDIYKKFDDYNPNKKCSILLVFDDMMLIWLATNNLI